MITFEVVLAGEMRRPWSVPTRLHVDARNGEGSVSYEIVSYVRRSGSTVDAGHCIAVVWNGQGWRVINDDKVHVDVIEGDLPAEVKDYVRLAYFRRLT